MDVQPEEEEEEEDEEEQEEEEDSSDWLTDGYIYIHFYLRLWLHCLKEKSVINVVFNHGNKTSIRIN